MQFFLLRRDLRECFFGFRVAFDWPLRL